MDARESKSEPHMVFTDEMVEQAARAIAEQGILALDGKPASWDRHADGFRDMARAALDAAFKDVPAVNYGIGLMLQFFEHVVGVKAGAGAGVYVRNDDPHGFDALGHHVNLTYRRDGSLSTISVTRIGDER